MDTSTADATTALEWAWVPQQDDYRTAVRTNRSARAIWLAGAYAAAGVVFIVIGVAHQDGTAIGLGVGIAVFAGFCLFTAPRLAARRFFAEDFLSNQRRVRVAPDGLTTLTPSGTSTTYWPAFLTCTQVGDLYVLRLHKNTKRGPRPGGFLVLAARGLPQPGDEPRLRDLLDRYLDVPVRSRS